VHLALQTSLTMVFTVLRLLNTLLMPVRTNLGITLT
jgi:hypothetical protein